MRAAADDPPERAARQGGPRWLIALLGVAVVVLSAVLVTYERVVEVSPAFPPGCDMEGRYELRERLWGGGQWYRVDADGAAEVIDLGARSEPYAPIECPVGMNG